MGAILRARQRWDRQGRIYDGHLGILTVSDTAMVAVVALLIAFLLPTGGQWGPANAVYSVSRAPLVHWEEDFNRLFAGLPARRPLPYRIWGDTMAFQGTINPTDTPVLQVNSPVPLYWKARSYAKYTHEGWLSEGAVLREPGWQPEYSAPNPNQERFNVTFEVIPNYDSRSLFAGGQAIGANRDIRIETFDSPRYVIDPHLNSGTDDLPAVLRQAVAGVRESVAADAYATDEAIAANLPSSFVLETVARAGTGSVLHAVIGEIVPRRAGRSVRARRRRRCRLRRTVPTHGLGLLRRAGATPLRRRRVRPLGSGPATPSSPTICRRGGPASPASLTADAATPYDKAVAVESYLKDNLAYNLAIDPPPFGVDGVDYFLFESREGYSEYFGSAMTVLMRSLGIPARMTTGYTAGNAVADPASLWCPTITATVGRKFISPATAGCPLNPPPARKSAALPPEEQARRGGAVPMAARMPATCPAKSKRTAKTLSRCSMKKTS